MRSKKGIVISNKMDKTIIVKIENYRVHSKYKKRYKISRKFYAHDPEKKYKTGDNVVIYETRPLSKLKRWTVVEPKKTIRNL